MAVLQDSGIKLKPTQVPVVKEIIEALKTYDHVILVAPTGAGKSYIGQAVIQNFDWGYYGVPSKLLQNQIEGDMNGVVRDLILLKGKSNYMCTKFRQDPQDPKSPFVTADRADCWGKRGINTRRNCLESGACDYLCTRADAMDSTDVVMNTAAFMTWRKITESIYTSAAKKGSVPNQTWFPKRTIHVFDECHKLEDAMTEFIAISILEKDMINAFRSAREYYYEHAKAKGLAFPEPKIKLGEVQQHTTSESIIAYLYRAKASLDIYVAIMEEATGESWSNLMLDVEEDGDREFKRALRKFKEIYLKLDLFVKDESNHSNYVFHTDYNKDMTKGSKKDSWIIAKPILVGKQFQSLMAGKKNLYMSATIPLIPSFALSIGLEVGNYKVIEMPSTFPAENRPVYFKTLGRFNAGNIKSMVPTIAETIMKVMQKFDDDKGIIHVTSFDLQTEIKKILDQTTLGSRILYSTRKADKEAEHISNEELIDEHIDSTEPSVLFSPSMAEGVSLKDDLSRFQVVVKCPWPSMGDPIVKARIARDRNWMTMKVLTTFMQQIGRSVRHEKDHAKTYVLDECLATEVRKGIGNGWLPKYVVEALKGI